MGEVGGLFVLTKTHEALEIRYTYAKSQRVYGSSEGGISEGQGSLRKIETHVMPAHVSIEKNRDTDAKSRRKGLHAELGWSL